MARELALINGDLSHFLGAYIGSAANIIKAAKVILLNYFLSIYIYIYCRVILAYDLFIGY